MTDTLERREAIARIIDPEAWKNIPNLPSDQLYWQNAARQTSLAKADAILALTTSPRVDEGRVEVVAAAIQASAAGLDSDPSQRTWDACTEATKENFRRHARNVLAALTTTPADPRVGKMEAHLDEKE